MLPLGAALMTLLAITSANPAPPSIVEDGQSLPAYEKMFEKVSGWTGADGAFTVALPDGRILWLFSDTWVGAVVDNRHVDAVMINNSIALQDGAGPDSRLAFFHGEDAAGKPRAFIVPDEGDGWYWLAGAMVLKGKLYITLSQIVKTDGKGVFGFKQSDTKLAIVENPLDPPPQWRVSQRRISFGRYGGERDIVFGVTYLHHEDWVYIYGFGDAPEKGIARRQMMLAKAPEERFEDFIVWEFLAADGQWRTTPEEAAGLFDGFASEFSVSYLPGLKKFVTVYTEFGMSGTILVRTADTPAGPWSESRRVYACPEVQWDKDNFCYAAKAHPELARRDDELIITYVCNSFDFGKMAANASIYRPRFVGVTLK